MPKTTYRAKLIIKQFLSFIKVKFFTHKDEKGMHMIKTYVPHTDNRYYFDEHLNLYGPKGKLGNHITKAGYIGVLIDRRYHPTIRGVHRAIAETFIPNPHNLPCVNHKDGCKTNNVIDNLEWVSYSDNTKHALLAGLFTPIKGEDIHTSKLAIEQVIDIINAMLYESATNEQLADQYGLHSRYISLIRHKHRWKHVWDEFFPGLTAPKSNQPVTLHEVKSQFTTEERLKIIKAVFETNLTNTQIQNLYGIERSNVSRIRHKKLWKKTLNNYFKSLTTIPNGSTPEAIAGGNSEGPDIQDLDMVCSI